MTSTIQTKAARRTEGTMNSDRICDLLGDAKSSLVMALRTAQQSNAPASVIKLLDALCCKTELAQYKVRGKQ